MKSSRLLEMLLLLQTRGSVTAAELAERLEVSPRTVYRDVEALSSAGVPVYAERGRGGGIRLLAGFRTDVTGLTHDEARALFVLTTGGAQADLGLAAPLRSAISKVLQAVPSPFQPTATAASQRILVDPVGWMRQADALGELGTLQSAVFSGRRVLLRYRSSGQQRSSERVVDPYGLVCKSGVWYLVADSAREPRLFRVSRVEAAFVADEPAIRRDGVGLADLWENLRRQVDERPTPVRVTARVRRSRLDMFRRMCAAHLADPAADSNPSDEAPADHAPAAGAPASGALAAGGPADDLPTDNLRADSGLAGGTPADRGSADCGEWADVTLRFAAVQAARILLSFGGDVVVTSPPEVREDLLAVAAAVTACYAARAGTPLRSASRVGPLSRNDDCVRAWEQEPRLPVGKPHQVRRLAAGPVHLHDFAVLVWVADDASVNADLVTDRRFHDHLPRR
jgi:predicted DNA-binding transcriptional regulator YafY